jgi:molybdopterin molybdotransferase
LLKTARALKPACDVLLLSGGAGSGDHDLGRKLLARLGFRIHFASVNLRPGKPLVFATRGRQAAFVLPGNPVSHLVTLHAAVRLAFDCLAGARPVWPLLRVRLASPLDSKPAGRETFWPARLEPAADGKLAAQPLRWQSSGDVTGLAGLNALLQLPAGAPAPRSGGWISALMLEVP